MAKTTKKRTLGKSSIKKDKKSNRKSSCRDKFKKRSSSVLEKTYNERDEKSSAFGNGKSIFKEDVLKELGIEVFQNASGGNFFEILPISYDETVPYFFEVPVHMGVGADNDQFICNKRIGKGKCYRCEKQQKGYKSEEYKLNKESLKDELKALFPIDRIIYLVWNRTEELESGEDQTFKINIWSAPKSKIHSEVQSKTRNKRTKENIDVSDVSEDGEGKTVYFEYTPSTGAGTFAQYTGVDLIDREESIPDEILEKLDEIITYCYEQGFKSNPLEVLLHFPDYDEVKESMMTEEDEEDEPSSKSSSKKGNKKDKEEEIDEDEVMEKIEELKEELEDLSNIKFKRWCKENDYFDKLEEDGIDIEDRDDAIDYIADDFFQRMLSGDDELPF